MFLFKHKEDVPVDDRLNIGAVVKFKTDDPDFKRYNNRKAIIIYELSEDDCNCECYCYRIQFKSGDEIDAFDYELAYA